MKYVFVALAAFYLSSCVSMSDDSKERAQLHQQIGNSYYQSGRYPEALTELLKAERLDSRNPFIQNNLGLVYFSLQRSDLAEKYLRRALEIAPAYSDARNNLARVYIEQKKYKEAEVALKKVFEDLTYTDSARAYFHFGLSRFEQKDWTQAQHYFAKAVQLRRDECAFQTYLGRTYLEEGFFSQATDTLDRAVGFCQKTFDDEAHYYSAVAWYRLGDKRRSAARFEELIKIYPEGKFRGKARSMLDVVKKEIE